jgi:threonine 3-dehydrogenase
MQAIIKPTAGEGFAVVNDQLVPQPAAGQVAIAVQAASLCGTDVHITQWDAWSASRIKPPMVFGHEFSGIVTAIGEGVTHVAVGDRVSAEMHQFERHSKPDGEVTYKDTGVIFGVDRPGCFADFIVLPQYQCVKLPESVSFEVGACLDSLGNAVHAASQVDLTDKTVFVSGCGPIGLYAIPVARALGAKAVYAADVSSYRLALAEKAQPDNVWHAIERPTASALLEETSGKGVDVVLEMSGNPHAFQAALQGLAIGGSLVQLGLLPSMPTIDINKDIIFKSARLIGVNGRAIFDTWHLMLELLTSGKLSIDFILTHCLPFSRFGEAVNAAASGESGKIILIPDELYNSTS